MIDYPADVRIERAPRSSRLWAILTIFWIKPFALIPHFIILAVLGIAQFIAFIVAQFAVAITGSYPQGIHDFVAAVIRWSVRVGAFFLSLTDCYPPFSLSAGGYAVDYEVRRPEKSSRALAVITLVVFFAAWIIGAAAAAKASHWGYSGSSYSSTWANIRYLLALPHLVVLFFYGIGVFFVWFAAQLVILFSGRLPEGMHDFMGRFVRWGARVSAFAYGLRDDYPPFSGEPGPGAQAAPGGPEAASGGPLLSREPAPGAGAPAPAVWDIPGAQQMPGAQPSPGGEAAPEGGSPPPTQS